MFQLSGQTGFIKSKNEESELFNFCRQMKLKASSDLQPIHSTELSPEPCSGFKEVEPPKRNETSRFFEIPERFGAFHYSSFKTLDPLVLQHWRSFLIVCSEVIRLCRCHFYLCLHFITFITNFSISEYFYGSSRGREMDSGSGDPSEALHLFSFVAESKIP